MSRKSFWVFIIGAVVAVALATANVSAQGRGGPGGRGRGFGGPGPGGGFNVMGLLGVEEVAQRLNLPRNSKTSSAKRPSKHVRIARVASGRIFKT